MIVESAGDVEEGVACGRLFGDEVGGLVEKVGLFWLDIVECRDAVDALAEAGEGHIGESANTGEGEVDEDDGPVVVIVDLDDAVLVELANFVADKLGGEVAVGVEEDEVGEGGGACAGEQSGAGEVGALSDFLPEADVSLI